MATHSRTALDAWQSFWPKRKSLSSSFLWIWSRVSKRPLKFWRSSLLVKYHTSWVVKLFGILLPSPQGRRRLHSVRKSGYLPLHCDQILVSRNSSRSYRAQSSGEIWRSRIYWDSQLRSIRVWCCYREDSEAVRILITRYYFELLILISIGVESWAEALTRRS